MNDNLRARFKDAPWFPKEDIHVLIGGAGGIGSWTTLLLSRAGFKPIVYDFDIIEEHNIGGQLFNKQHIGMPKTIALQVVVKSFADTDLIVFNEKITTKSMTNNYCISAFDNMDARKAMFTSWLKMYGTDPNAVFIDGRLQAEHMQIFCVRGVEQQTNNYFENLFDDSEVEDAPCTMRQTSHAAAMIASHMVSFFTNHITNVIEKELIRSVPFMWEYFIPMDFLDVK